MTPRQYWRPPELRRTEMKSPLAHGIRRNDAGLFLYGIDDDGFCLTERYDEDRAILDCSTLREFDEARYRLQKQQLGIDDPRLGGAPYRGSLYLDEARMYINGYLARAMLSMAPGYIYSRLCEASRTSLMTLIPHRYVRGKNHGKVEGRYRRWDMHLDAHGQNGVLEELRRRVRRYEKSRFDALLTQWDAARRLGVYFVDNPKPLDADLHVAFSDKVTLQSVRFRSFVQDCHSIELPSRELEEAVSEERKQLAHFIAEQHADVLRSSDPKVVRFREKRRILVTKWGHR